MNNKEAQIGNDRKNLFLDSLLELTKVEFNNLCEKNSKSQNKLLYKAYKQTNSLRKIRRLSKKYELFVPHETYRSTFIPFVFKKVLSNPNIDSYKHATKYLEAYNKVMNHIHDELSTTEVKSCFDNYTYEFLKTNLTN